jgi:hypothetical protein
VTTSEDFGFPEGPTRRYVGQVGAGKGSIVADPFQANLLFHWLTNDTYLLRQARNEIAADTAGFMYLSP